MAHFRSVVVPTKVLLAPQVRSVLSHLCCQTLYVIGDLPLPSALSIPPSVKVLPIKGSLDYETISHFESHPCFKGSGFFYPVAIIAHNNNEVMMAVQRERAYHNPIMFFPMESIISSSLVDSLRLSHSEHQKVGMYHYRCHINGCNARGDSYFGIEKHSLEKHKAPEGVFQNRDSGGWHPDQLFKLQLFSLENESEPSGKQEWPK